MEQDATSHVPERALAVFAHCDDIEFGACGTVARWVAAGAQVTYCIVTDSGAGGNDPGIDLEKLKQTRRQEQIDAADAVGVQDVRFFEGYQDGTLQPTMALRKQITALIRETRPDTVVTFDPETVFSADRGYVNHPDHRAVAEATLYAVFPSAGSRPIFADLLDEGLEPHDVMWLYMTLTNHPDLHVDITDVIERKTAALRCHASQYGDDVVQMVVGWNKEAGEQVGTGYAESFRTLKLRDGAPDQEAE